MRKEILTKKFWQHILKLDPNIKIFTGASLTE